MPRISNGHSSDVTCVCVYAGLGCRISLRLELLGGSAFLMFGMLVSIGPGSQVLKGTPDSAPAHCKTLQDYAPVSQRVRPDPQSSRRLRHAPETSRDAAPKHDPVWGRLTYGAVWSMSSCHLGSAMHLWQHRKLARPGGGSRSRQAGKAIAG